MTLLVYIVTFISYCLYKWSKPKGKKQYDYPLASDTITTWEQYEAFFKDAVVREIDHLTTLLDRNRVTAFQDAPLLFRLASCMKSILIHMPKVTSYDEGCQDLYRYCIHHETINADTRVITHIVGFIMLTCVINDTDFDVKPGRYQEWYTEPLYVRYGHYLACLAIETKTEPLDTNCNDIEKV